MKFIRKNGRIIPVREKGESSDKFESRMTKTDVKTGAAVGAASVLAFKRPKFRAALAIGSAAFGLRTTVARIKEHGLVKGAWEDTKSSLLKMGAGIAGGVAAGGTLGYLNFLNKARKAKKSSVPIIKIAGLLK